MKFSLAFTCVVTFASATIARANLPIQSFIFAPSSNDPWSGQMVLDEDMRPASQAIAWDSWSDISSYQGRTPLNGHELGEDMAIQPGTSGILGDFGFVLFNDTATPAAGTFTVQYTCYDTHDTLLFRRSLSFLILDSFPIHPNGGARFSWGEGFLRSRGDVLPEECTFSLLIESDFPLMSELDTVYAPLAIGNSSRLYRDFTTGQDIELPADQTLQCSSQLIQCRRRAQSQCFLQGRASPHVGSGSNNQTWTSHRTIRELFVSGTVFLCNFC